MKNNVGILVLVSVCFLAGSFCHAQGKSSKQKLVVAKNTVADVLAKTKETSVFYESIQKSTHVQSLKSDLNYTVFAPINEAFTKPVTDSAGNLAPAGLVPADHQSLCGNHIVEGIVTVSALLEMIKANNWKAELKTISGSTLTAVLDNGKIKLTDAAGHSAWIIRYNQQAQNGMIHQLDHVLQ